MSVAVSTELKALQTRQSQADAEVSQIEQESRSIQNRLNQARQRSKVIADQIGKLKAQSAGIIVTEHAMLRYIERVIGINMDELRGKVLPESAETVAKAMGGNVRLPVDGHTVVIKNGTVVTVLTADDQTG